MLLSNIFYEVHRRYPTVEEAEEFLEEVMIQWSFTAAHVELPEEVRAKEIELLLEKSVEQVSVDEVYAQFEEKIQAVRLDRLIQSATYFWRSGSDYYSDDLRVVNRL